MHTGNILASNILAGNIQQHHAEVDSTIALDASLLQKDLDATFFLVLVLVLAFLPKWKMKI